MSYLSLESNKAIAYSKSTNRLHKKTATLRLIFAYLNCFLILLLLCLMIIIKLQSKASNT